MGTSFFSELYSWISFVPRIGFKNIVEILIITFLIYKIIIWIRDTRASVLLKGIGFIFAFFVFAAVLELDTILWLMEKFSVIAVTAVLVIFQQELRRALEQLGSQKMFGSLFQSVEEAQKEEFSEQTVGELVRACFEMSRVKTGALMVLERESPLSEIRRTGIDIEGLVSSQLLINIFEHNTPLHDGAVVIRGNRVAAATCYLPLSENNEISKAYGTRHRAAIGISENTDSVTLVVSEETGQVSVAIGGALQEASTQEQLRDILETQMLRGEPTGNRHFGSLWKRRKHEGNDSE